MGVIIQFAVSFWPFSVFVAVVHVAQLSESFGFNPPWSKKQSAEAVLENSMVRY